MTCNECHHVPSGRWTDEGRTCYCKCHDVADAAQELLASCKEALDLIASEHQQVDSGEWDSDDARGVAELLEAAIAKATGESS